MEVKIQKLEHVKWQELKILQNPNLKEMSKDDFYKLKLSLKNNSFIDPFKVWNSNKVIYCLDGKHRVEAMYELIKEGTHIPEKLPAVFIHCNDISEAAKYVLIFSSRYARITYDGLYEFIHIHGIADDFDDIASYTDIPDIDLPMFYNGYLTDIQPDSFTAENIETIGEHMPTLITCPNCGFKFEKGKKYKFGKKEYESRTAEIKK